MSWNRRGSVWVILVVVVVLAVQWTLFPLPKVASAPTAQDIWALPVVGGVQLQPALEVLAATTPWGAVIASRPAAETVEEKWRIIGVAGVGRSRTVLVQVGQQPERHLSMGDNIPGGGKIIQIGEDDFVVLENGHRRRVEVFPRVLSGS